MIDAITENSLCPTGVEGLDEILAGGFPSRRLYFIQGDPGSGKQLQMQSIAHGVVIMRYFEAGGEVKKAVSVIKKRYGPHEKGLREVRMGPEGMRVGPPLKEFQGVLKGVPTCFGANPEHAAAHVAR